VSMCDRAPYPITRLENHNFCSAHQYQQEVDRRDMRCLDNENAPQAQ
jgi:hypothetical protein